MQSNLPATLVATGNNLLNTPVVSTSYSAFLAILSQINNAERNSKQVKSMALDQILH